MKLPALREIVEERKEKAIEELSDCFAKNKLPLEEYERLVEYIHKIESERELIVVEKIVAEYGAEYGGAEQGENDALDDYDDDEPAHFIRRRSSGSNLTILSSRTFRGPLKSGSAFVSILGSTHIEVRKADLEKKRTVLDLVSILGDSVVFVEPGIRVINKAVPILGSAGTSQKAQKQAQAGGPELLISGVALLGDISVKLIKD